MSESSRLSFSSLIELSYYLNMYRVPFSDAKEFNKVKPEPRNPWMLSLLVPVSDNAVCSC